MYLCLYLCVRMCATVHAWKHEDSLQESVLAFYHYGNGTRVIGLAAETLT